MSESDAEMDSSLGILSPSDMKTSGIMSMTASQASNQGTFTTLQNSSRNTIFSLNRFLAKNLPNFDQPNHCHCCQPTYSFSKIKLLY